MLSNVLQAYGLTNAAVEPLGNGLINHTWKASADGRQYVLQRINEKIFPYPQQIAANIKGIGDYLRAAHPGYLFTRPIASADGKEMVCVDDAHYRLFPFVEGSHTVDVVSTPEQAFEAAAQFGKFTRLLAGFDAATLQTTLPHFHDLALRYGRLLQAIKTGKAGRIAAAKKVIDALLSRTDIVAVFNRLHTARGFKKRVTHHDAKISNVLFDREGKGLCVIDLDTVMPGYFISDAGDMLRTYLSPAGEEESDLSKIDVRVDFYRAVAEGYQQAMRDALSATERAHFFYAGEFLIYMQALRFLTDYLNNDAYYGAAYEGHNLLRAQNQAALLQRYGEKKAALKKMI